MKPKIIIILIFLLLMNLYPINIAFAKGQTVPQSILEIVVKSSEKSEFYSSLVVDDGGWLMDQIISSPHISVNRTPELSLAYLIFHDGEEKEQFIFSYSWNLFDTKNKTMYQLSPKLKEILIHYVNILSRNHYGQPLEWEEVKSIFHRKKLAEVVDVETGKSFVVQRRAGSRHADVQPLTKEDSKVMKEIYNGKWSWKRRAIIVKVGEKKIAASMHGMPHGAGAIRQNKFPGHFCIHFNGSTTHRRNEPDPSHQLMMLKASGQLNKKIYEADPQELVDIFLSALNEQDLYMLERTLDQSNRFVKDQLLMKSADISGIRKNPSKDKAKRKEETKKEKYIDEEDLMFVTVPVSVAGYKTDQSQFKKELTIIVKRDFLFNRWKIDPQSVLPLFE